MVLKDQGQNQILPENHPELQAEDSTPELHHEPGFSREYEGQRAHIEPGEEGEEEEMGKAAKVSLSRGIWIGAATFVPTFLAVFFGIPYLLGSLMPNPSRVTLEHGTGSAVSSNARDTDLSSPALPQGIAAMMPSDKAAVPKGGHSDEPLRLPAMLVSEGPTDARGPEVSGDSPQATPLPPPRTQSRPTAAEPHRSALDQSASDRSGSASTKVSSWTPTAAFADRDSAERVAASLKREGHPVEVRRDDSTTDRPWVVWVGTQPRGTLSERRR